MKIVVLDGKMLNPGDNPWDEVASFGEFIVHDRTSPADVLERAQGAEILITNKTVITAEHLAQLPKVKFIALTSTGYNAVDVVAAKARGVPVSNVPEYGTDSVAQFTIALLLELCHRIQKHSDAVYAGAWTTGPDFCFWDTPQSELAGKTLAIIGYGRIGKRVAEIAKALGMKVVPVGKEKNELMVALRDADVVTLHCPLTPENTGFVNKEFLSHMKPSAFLLNAARGALVAEQDLADALNEGKIAGAAIDVVSVEPIKADNPLLQAKNCIITPHIAWVSIEARRRLMHATAENVRAFLAGKPINVVNP